jgi:Tfp pilus assembly protein PilV
MEVQSMYKKILQSGNTVIEVLVATVVVGLILTALAVNMSSSIQNSAEAQYRETGTSLAQDVMEVFRKDKNTQSWATFTSTPADNTADTTTNPSSSKVRCIPASFTVNTQLLGSTEFNRSAVGSYCGGYVSVINNINYYRLVSKTTSGNSVKIVVYVYWNVGTAKERSTSVEQTFFQAQ